MFSDSNQRRGPEELKRDWSWYLATGAVLLIFGFTIERAYLLTNASVLFFGWLMMVVGTIEAAIAFWKERGGHSFFVDLLAGVLYAVVGFMVVAHPAATEAGLSLVITTFLIVQGIYRIAAAVAVRLPNSGWVLLHGVASLLLGISVWLQWPLEGVWVLGLFVGAEMILNGWSLVMLGLAAKNLTANNESEPQAAADVTKAVESA